MVGLFMFVLFDDWGFSLELFGVVYFLLGVL